MGHRRPRAHESAKIDLSYVTPNAVAAVIIHPKRVLTDPDMMKGLPVDMLKAGAKESLGIDPFEIEQVMVIVEPPQSRDPQVVVVLRMASPVKGKVFPDLWQKTTEDKLDGKTYRKATSPNGASIFQPDDNTIILGNDEMLRQVWSNRANPQEGTMSRVLARIEAAPDAMAILLIDPIRPMIAAPLAMAPVPPPLADVKKIPELLTSIGVKANLTSDIGLTLSLKATDEAAAEELEGIINKALEMARQAVDAQMAQMKDAPPQMQMQAQVMKQVNDNVLKPLKPERKGRMVTLALKADSQNPQAKAAAVGAAVGTALPAILAAREAARRTASMNNMKMIALAMHSYAQKEKTFPPAYKADASGKALLSWRVLILPYLGEDALFKEFNLDEPWDSAHNKPLIAKMPAMFGSPKSAVAKDGKTTYLTVRGEKTMFPGAKGIGPAEITDGLSNTVMTVEVPDASAVEWTKPDDFAYDETNPLKGLTGMGSPSFLAALADGSVRTFSTMFDPATLKLLFMRNDGTPIDKMKW